MTKILCYAIYIPGPAYARFSMVADGSCVEIDHILLLHLSKKNTLNKLKLDFFGSYTLPLSFFSLHQLTDLYLNDCALQLQPSFNGFGSLTTFHLQEIRISKEALLRLLTSCPLLKRLALLSNAGTIDVRGDSTIVDLIFLCFLPLSKELPTKLVYLKYVFMEYVWFRHKYAVPFLVLLIRSSPNLEKLKLEIYADDDKSQMGSFELEGCSDITLEHLNKLEILHFSDAENELDFVKFILAKSPVLKKVRILLWDQCDEDEKLQISEIILSSPCASPMVKIIVS